jgi:hypothetical protein
MNTIIRAVILCSFLNLTLNADKLKLITVLYNETNYARIGEYKTCMQKNLSHPSIDAIHVVYDISKDDQNCYLLEYLKSLPITISFVTGRPSFAHCFRVANELYPESKIILSNADIYFNNTLSVLENYDLVGKFLAITRKNIDKNGKLLNLPGAYIGKPEPSQDVWMFSTPILVSPREDITIGLVHCEGEISYAAKSSQLHVINPYFSIDCCHLHMSNVRHWVDRPYPDKPIYIAPLTYLPGVDK